MYDWVALLSVFALFINIVLYFVEVWFSHGVTMTLRNIIGAMFQIMACTSMSSFRTSGLKICCALSLGELTIKGFLGLTISQFSLKYFVHLLD